MTGGWLEWGTMRGRPFVLAWREDDTEEALRETYLAEHDGALRSRLHGPWLFRSGTTLGAVAEVLGVHYRSVQRWVAWYRQGGVVAVRFPDRRGAGRDRRRSGDRAVPHGGRRPRLDCPGLRRQLYTM